MQSFLATLTAVLSVQNPDFIRWEMLWVRQNAFHIFFSTIVDPHDFLPLFLLAAYVSYSSLPHSEEFSLPWAQGEPLVYSKRLFRRLNYRKHLKGKKKEKNPEYIDSRDIIRWIEMLFFCSAKMTALRKPPWSLMSCKGADTTGRHIPRK